MHFYVEIAHKGTLFCANGQANVKKNSGQAKRTAERGTTSAFIQRRRQGAGRKERKTESQGRGKYICIRGIFIVPLQGNVQGRAGGGGGPDSPEFPDTPGILRRRKEKRKEKRGEEGKRGRGEDGKRGRGEGDETERDKRKRGERNAKRMMRRYLSNDRNRKDHNMNNMKGTI